MAKLVVEELTVDQMHGAKFSFGSPQSYSTYWVESGPFLPKPQGVEVGLTS